MGYRSARSQPPHVRQTARIHCTASTLATMSSASVTFRAVRSVRFRHRLRAFFVVFPVAIQATVTSFWAGVCKATTATKTSQVCTGRGFSISRGRAVRGLGRLNYPVTPLRCTPPEGDASVTAKPGREYFALPAEQIQHWAETFPVLRCNSRAGGIDRAAFGLGAA